MALFDEKTESKLNDLIEKAYDAEKGFRKAADHVDDSRLKTFFTEKARVRSGYITDLRSLLTKHGMDVIEKDGSASGSMHRAWIDTKAFFSTDEEESMLEEVRKGEKQAIDDYDDILDNCELNQPVRDLLEQQKAEIVESYNKADYLEDIH